MEKTLVQDEKYVAKYVALKSPEDATVVGSGNDPAEALKNARKRGYRKPYLMYVPGQEQVKAHSC